MGEPAIRPEGLCQIGFIVQDIEASARKYSETFGLPMPEIIETAGYDRSKTTYAGEPCDATAKLAFLNTGQVVIELIEPDEKPSVWRDHLEKHGEGVHHVAFEVADAGRAETALARFGMRPAQQGLYSDASGRYSYIDSAPYLGVMIELLETFKKV